MSYKAASTKVQPCGELIFCETGLDCTDVCTGAPTGYVRTALGTNNQRFFRLWHKMPDGRFGKRGYTPLCRCTRVPPRRVKPVCTGLPPHTCTAALLRYPISPILTYMRVALMSVVAREGKSPRRWDKYGISGCDAPLMHRSRHREPERERWR